MTETNFKGPFRLAVATVALIVALAPASASSLEPGDTDALSGSEESITTGDSVTEAVPDGVSSVEEELYFSEEEMVTGPTKREVPLAEAPANVTVITHEDIIQSGALNLGEVFRRVAGMDVVTITAGDTQVSARGFVGNVAENNRMSVMIDGMTFYLEFLGGTLWGQFPVPLDDIKRIEVIKGPMSSLYGNRAMLGIINIVTYDPEETRTKIGGGGGRFRMATGEFIHAGKFADGYWYKITGAYNRSDEFSDAGGDGRTKDREDLALQGRLSFQPFDATKFELTGWIVQSTERLDTIGLNRWDNRRSTVDGKFKQDLGRWGDIFFQTYWERNSGSSPTLGIGTPVVVDSVDSEIRHSIALDFTSHIMNTTTYGFNYRYINSDNPLVNALNNLGGFFQNETRFYDRVILTAGMRIDYQKDFSGTNISAQGDIVFLIHPRYTLRLGTATAFATPTLLEYFTGLDTPVVNIPPITTVRITGNRNLNAERILYFDIGNTIRPIDGMRLHAEFFYYRLNDLIIPTLFFPDPTTLTFSFINGGGARAMGCEIGIDEDITDWLTGYANWSFQDFKAINGNGNPTPNMGNPKNKVSAGLRGYWFDRRLSFNLDFEYVQKHQSRNGVINFNFTPVINVDHLFLLNARLAFWPIKDHLEIAVAANNILDDNSPQIPNYDPLFNIWLAEQPRFNIWGSLRYVF